MASKCWCCKNEPSTGSTCDCVVFTDDAEYCVNCASLPCLNCGEKESVHGIGGYYCKDFTLEKKEAAICENCEKSHETEYYPHPIDASLCKKCFGQYGKVEAG